MMTVRLPDPHPSLQEVRERLALAPGDVDEAFGLVEIDPEQHLYTFLVDESVAARIPGGGEWTAAGPFSNPRIEAFGPPVAEAAKPARK